MKVLRPETMDPLIPGILLISHGSYAGALMECADQIYGISGNVACLTLETGDSPEIFRDEVKEMIGCLPEGSVILVDIVGGSPYNQVILSMGEERPGPEIVVGMNLPMLVTMLHARKSIKGEALAREGMRSGREGIRRVDLKDFYT